MTLEDAAALLPPTVVDQPGYLDYLGALEEGRLREALDALTQLGAEHDAPVEFWVALSSFDGDLQA